MYTSYYIVVSWVAVFCGVGWLRGEVTSEPDTPLPPSQKQVCSLSDTPPPPETVREPVNKGELVAFSLRGKLYDYSRHHHSGILSQYPGVAPEVHVIDLLIDLL